MRRYAASHAEHFRMWLQSTDFVYHKNGWLIDRHDSFSSPEWDRQTEFRSVGAASLEPKSATVRFDDRRANGKTQAQSLLLGGGERLEDAVNNLRTHPRSIIVNDDFQVGASLGMPRRNGHASFLPTHAGNCLDRVTNKVENNLRQLAPISVQRGEIRLDERLDSNRRHRDL